MKKMNDYRVIYKERGTRNKQRFEKIVTCEGIKQATDYARKELDKNYTVLSVTRSRRKVIQ